LANTLLAYVLFGIRIRLSPTKDAHAKRQVTCRLEAPAIPAFCNVFLDTICSRRIIETCRIRLGPITNKLSGLPQCGAATLVPSIVTERLQLAKNVLDPGQFEIESVSHW